MRLKIGIVWSLFLGSVVLIPPTHAGTSLGWLTNAQIDTEQTSSRQPDKLNEKIAT